MIRIVDASEMGNVRLLMYLVELAETLRQSDLDEIAASSGEDSMTALVASVMVSDHCWIIFDDLNDPIAIFGCGPTTVLGQGFVWMLGTDAMDKPSNALGILRQSRHYKDIMQVPYPILYNWVDVRNTKSRKWLQWCGYEELMEEPEHGVEKRPFKLYARVKPYV